MIWLYAFVLSLASAKTHHHKAHSTAAEKPFPSNKVHMTTVATCKAPKDAAKKVYIIKQWHLAPSTTTKGFKEKYPQEKNQTAIYHFLEEGAKRQQLQVVISEGCEGDIDMEFTTPFNGWDYESLKAQAFQKNYDKIITLVPLKISAKYGEKIRVTCGDSEDLIKDGNLHLSNLRGWEGFYVRLTENKDNPEKFKFYAESAEDLLKIPKTTTKEELMKTIKDEIKSELKEFSSTLDERNDSFVDTLNDEDFTKAAIVIGGLHAEDLKAKVEKAGIACEVLEPPGYQREDEKLIQDFERAIN